VALDKLTTGQIRELTDTELADKIVELERERDALRFKAGTEVLASPMDLRAARRTVARLQTERAERARKAGAR